MTYPNGDIRKGYFDQTWIGDAVFYEKRGKTKPWRERWIHGSYDSSVAIFKSVLDEYQSITVELVCKVHSLSAVPELLKDGIKIEDAIIEPFRMANQEVQTIRVRLDFSDDPFKVSWNTFGIIEIQTELKKSFEIIISLFTYRPSKFKFMHFQDF